MHETCTGPIAGVFSASAVMCRHLFVFGHNTMSGNDHRNENLEPTTSSKDENLDFEGDKDIQTKDPLPFDPMTLLLARD